jgi:hypothetical protein
LLALRFGGAESNSDIRQHRREPRGLNVGALETDGSDFSLGVVSILTSQVSFRSQSWRDLLAERITARDQTRIKLLCLQGWR